MIVRAFTYEALPMRVRFGTGAVAALADEVAHLDLRRALILCTPRQLALGERLSAVVGERSAGVVPEAREHVPEEIADLVCARAGRVGADGCVVVGGGSAIGLGKIVARALGLPIVAVPTTYSGSEMTPLWGRTRNGRKTTGKDTRVLPASVLYDPELTVELPVPVSVTSGLNAVAHAVEALYAPDASPVVSLMAAEGIAAMLTALPQIIESPADRAARSTALYGAWLCGACLGATAMSLHHKICHELGGTLDLPHAAVHAVVLPHALAYNQAAAPAARRTLAGLLGSLDPARALWELTGRWGAPRSLAELGMRADAIDAIAHRVGASPYANPAPVTVDGVRQLLHTAWVGRPPQNCDDQR